MVFRKQNEHQTQLLNSDKMYETLIDDDIFEKYGKEANMIACLNNIRVKRMGKGGLKFEFPIRKCRL
ncbi:MAG: hypothetical protein KAK00_09725 [Nanoarchaeota archaeon]|nr:hypothetical protein [Thermodesulfovibrionia bacterium]MCK5283659.1 hypothetical protein [Nanoarchaeota archaeon]